MITHEEIDSLKPLAESRGYGVSTNLFRGEQSAALEKQVGEKVGRTYYCKDLDKATAFLGQQPELPRFKVRATYTNGEVELFDFFEIDRRAAMIRGAADAEIMAGLRAEPPWTLKSLEIL